MHETRLHPSPPVRLLCLGGGVLALGLGLLGVVLPLLPTTPFILLAAACFARSSARFHRRLLGHPLVGPVIHEWHLHRAMPRRAKRLAWLLLTLSFGSSILLVPSPWHRGLLAGLGLTLAFFLWRVPVREPVASPSAQGGATQ
jgi:uncharacterized protein